MKKSLSFLVALALVFGLFASMAAAADADLTTAQKYQQLVDSKVLKGTTDGDPHLSNNLTRAEFATIAVAIAGLQEDTSGSAFSDVKVGQWWTGAIQAAYKAGLVEGVGNGLFQPKANVTVQEIIKVAVGIAGLTPVADAKVDGASDWAGPYIQAALDAGLPLPTNYKAAATRGQTIDLAYAVWLSKQVKPLDEVKAVVNADDTITVTGKTAGGVDGVKVAIGTADAVAATLNAGGTFTYTSSAQTAGSYDLTVTAYKGSTVVTSTKVSVTIDGFAVQDVKVLNGKQIAVQFNKPVQVGVATHGVSYDSDAGQAGIQGYFTLNTNTYPNRIDVSDDKMTVTLTFPNFTLDTYAQLAVSSGLYSASGKSLTSYKQAVYLSDTTAPTVSGVSYSGYTAKVSFSEPLASVGTISIDGYTAGNYPAGVTVADNTDAEGHITSVVVTVPTLGTNYSFSLIGGTDIAGNRFDYNTTINVPNDTTLPSVTSVTVSNTTLNVKFSEPVQSAGYVYQTSAGTSTQINGTVDSSDSTIAHYDVSGWLPTGGTFLTLGVTIAGYQDKVGLTGNNYQTSVTISKDTTSPTFDSVLASGNLLVLKFSESIDRTVSAIPASINVKSTNSSNVVTTVTGNLVNGNGYFDADNDGTAGESDELSYVAYQFTSLPSAKYDVTIPSGAFKDAAGNAASSVTRSVTVTTSPGGSMTVTIKTNDPAAPADNYDATLSNNQIKFVFSETLKPSSLTLANFTINGSALPSGTNLYFIDNQATVIAELPAGSITSSGSRLIAVDNVVAESGNTLNKDNSANYSKVLFLNENVKPVPQSVLLASDSQLVVNFSETLKPGNVTGVEVYINGNLVATQQAYATGNTVVIPAAANTFNATQTIQVKFVGSDAQDLKGNGVADTTVTK